MYHQDLSTGKLFVTFSRDSTCTKNLQSPWDGYEILTLNPDNKVKISETVNQQRCLFPIWSLGKWKDMKVREMVMVNNNKVVSNFCILKIINKL